MRHYIATHAPGHWTSVVCSARKSLWNNGSFIGKDVFSLSALRTRPVSRRRHCHAPVISTEADTSRHQCTQHTVLRQISDGRRWSRRRSEDWMEIVYRCSMYCLRT
jgi:hypothetical protein